ncbi:MAG TPA: rRNA maturation RNase YbeY [Anaerolineales bacterium]|nr:rRNA maturation RNase YbeY [Anaerolineales bacterium]
MKVEIRMNRGFADPALRAAIRQAARAALAAGSAAGDSSLTILVAGDETIRSLNVRFLDTDAPTDVLAFPAGEEPAGDEEGYLGDVVISLETARRQAEVGGHAPAHEVQLLTVHGVLHLLGHDHAGPAEKAAMWAAQTAALAALDNPLSPP